MSTSTVKEKDSRVPEGYVAIPVQQSEQSSAVKICVLARQTPEPVGGSFVLLRDQHDARVYLGALVDAGSRVREWLELWVQSVDGLDASLPAHRESFSNFSLDTRWAERADAFRELAGPRFLRTGWEAVHPLPTFLDLSQAAPVHPGTVEMAGTGSYAGTTNSSRPPAFPLTARRCSGISTSPPRRQGDPSSQ